MKRKIILETHAHNGAIRVLTSITMSNFTILDTWTTHRDV